MIYLTRRYRFSASHRLHNPALTEEENSRVYGKCNNPFGHGHNYTLEVTVAGPIDPATGMVFDLTRLDGLVEKDVLEPFDRTNLNLDVKIFHERVPTTENLCVEIYNILHDNFNSVNGWPQARLARVRLEETNSNFFEYLGESGEREPARHLLT